MCEVNRPKSQLLLLRTITDITGSAQHQEVGREVDQTAALPTNAQRKMRELVPETETATGESDLAAETAEGPGQETGNVLGKTSTACSDSCVCCYILSYHRT